MASTTMKSFIWRGARDSAPFALVIAPFGLLFGVVATEAGLNLVQVMGFSILVIAGAAQFSAVQLMAENAPTLIVLATALAVNLRHAMYSASLVPYLGAARVWQRALVAYSLVDQDYAVAFAKYESEPAMLLRERLFYYLGVTLPICPLWYASTFIGALAGTAIPEEFALDFALPITFLALIAPALKTLPHVIAALTSVVLSLALVGLPPGVGLLLAAACAMVAGAVSETVLERRA